MSQATIGIALVILAGFLQGTFGLLLKPIKPLKWENSWLIFSSIAMFLSPLLFALIFVPEFIQVFGLFPLTAVIIPLLLGVSWGVGSIFFGRSLDAIGVALTLTIVFGLSTLLGTSAPLFINKSVPQGETLLFLVLGLIFMLAGVLLSGFSGFIRDKSSSNPSKGIVLGLIFALISGVTSPMLNIGFVSGKNMELIAQSQGINPFVSTFITWVVVLSGGFLANLFYLIYLFFKNNSFTLFNKAKKQLLLLPVLAGLFWFLSFVFFGISSVNIGSLGASVGWGMFITLALVISNIWSIVFGEWKNSKRALRYQLFSMLIILIGVGFIAASIFLNS